MNKKLLISIIALSIITPTILSYAGLLGWYTTYKNYLIQYGGDPEQTIFTTTPLTVYTYGYLVNNELVRVNTKYGGTDHRVWIDESDYTPITIQRVPLRISEFIMTLQIQEG